MPQPCRSSNKTRITTRSSGKQPVPSIGANTQTDRYWGKSWYVWNNTGDTATLRDTTGHLLDQCTYTGKSQGYVFC